MSEQESGVASPSENKRAVVMAAMCVGVVIIVPVGIFLYPWLKYLLG